MVPDGTVWRVLEDLLVLDGERLSYRTLDVEQIGSVYQIVMGFEVEVASGPSLALRSKAKHGAAVIVDLQALAGLAPDKRQKALADLDVAKLTDREARAVKAARGIAELAEALAGKADRAAGADPRPQGARPGHGLGRVPGRGLSAARRGVGARLGGARVHARAAAGRGAATATATWTG